MSTCEFHDPITEGNACCVIVRLRQERDEAREELARWHSQLDRYTEERERAKRLARESAERADKLEAEARRLREAIDRIARVLHDPRHTKHYADHVAIDLARRALAGKEPTP